MKSKINKTTIMVTLSIMLLGCFPDEFGEGNGLSESSLDASFTITPSSSSPNRFTLLAQNTNYILSKWDLGDGAPAFIGNMEQEIFLPDAGTYTITHYAVGKGGFMQSATEELTVIVSDPNSGNIVLGGKFDSPTDIDEWTILNISASGTAWSFADGKAKVLGGGWNQQGIFQAINVIGGKTYTIDLVASSTSGVSNTWFEVYASPVEPVQGNDYSHDGIKRAINTWSGCGGSAFSGKISNIGCGSNTGTFTPTADGIIYLVIKCGGEDLKDGISIDNVEVRGQ